MKLAIFLRGYRVERELLYLELGKVLTLDELVFTSVEGKVFQHDVMCFERPVGFLCASM